MTSLRSEVKLNFMSYYKMGIYLNQPRVDQLKLGRAVHRKNWPSSSGGAN